jgi:conjugal transfer pilus assembly protein TraW
MRVSSNSLLILAFLVIGSSAHAKDLGTVGKTYPIKERDALLEIEERAKSLDMKREFARVKPDRYRPEGTIALPRAAKANSFQVDMTYTLDMDIPDGKGGILYPKGYTFNPLDYIPFRKVMVVLNGDDRDQVKWFRQSRYSGRPDVMLLLTEGSYLKLGKDLGRPVFFADNRIVSKFMLKAVPSVVYQTGRQMTVGEIDVRTASK